MPPPAPLADLRGAVRLAADAVTGVTDVVEEVHATVAWPFGRPRRTRGVAGAVYRVVRWVTKAVAGTLDGVIQVAEWRPRPEGGAPPTEAPTRAAVVAALNGAFGDGLAARDNPLAMPLQLCHGGQPLALDAASVARAVPSPSSTLLVLVHGLCMHDGGWDGEGRGSGAALAEGLGATAVALRYNTGQHVSTSGRAFADALEALVAAWPRDVTRLVVVGHSMGGLVARSAFHHAETAGHRWRGQAAALVTLGTPHHGAPLERLGSGIDALLDASRYAAPFARLGQARSAGVTDLRFGNVREEDWAGRARFARGPDRRTPLPLPRGVACFVVAATTGDGQGGLRDRTVGDGLVPLDSALGRHRDPARDLGVPPARQWVAPGMTHFDLLRRPEVIARLLAWLAPTP